MSALILSILVSFLLFLSMLLFFVFYKQRLPYYRVQRSDCLALLQQAAAGRVPVQDWDVFLGMSIRDSEHLESLRLRCLEIDELHRIGQKQVAGVDCAHYSQAGLKALAELLDEWSHNTNMTA